MRIVVFGTGGVGGYFGARLAVAGVPVAFVARGAQLAALRERGLQLFSPLGDARIAKVTASDNCATFGPTDIVLFCVKLYDTDSAAPLLKPLLGPDTGVISLQNGIDAEQRIAAAIGDKHVVGGVAYLSATIESPGVIRHLNRQAKLAFGELDGGSTPRLANFLNACQAAGFNATIEPDIVRTIWEKFVFLAAVAAVNGVTRLALGPILADADTRALMVNAMAETVAVAAARGVFLAPDLIDKTMAFAATQPPGVKASLLHDLERGHRLEIEGLSGAVARLGAEAGIATPVHSTVYAALKPYAQGRPDPAALAKSA